jgi:hypothetical protein
MALLLATPGWLDGNIRPGLGQPTLWLTRREQGIDWVEGLGREAL